MTLAEFLTQTQATVRSEIDERLTAPNGAYPYPEVVFTEVVMQHMAEIGMTFDPTPCHYEAKVGNANLRISGHAVSEDADQLDLFVSLYSGNDVPKPVTDAETKAAAEQCIRFLARCAEGKLAATMDESNDAYILAMTIQDCYPKLDQVRVYVLTDGIAKSKNFKPRDIAGKIVKLEVMDIERLHRHWSEGKPRDELVVNFNEVAGGPLPCIYVPGEMTEYDYALTVIPGEALRFAYEKYGARLLEANVRSFLSVTGKVNRGIRDTLRDSPEHFMAFNNGIVVVADEARLDRTADGSPGLVWLKGMQVVNGGQTTASIYFTKKKSPEINLSRVRVPAKIIVLRSRDAAAEEELIRSISKFANSQNAVKQSDLSANRPFHVELERLALSTYCPDGSTRWFYERAAGSYSTFLAREGSTPARLARIKESVPPAKKVTKTDLAKYLQAWEGKPHFVSQGAQKNFEKFMDSLVEQEEIGQAKLPDTAAYKRIIALAILYRAAQKVIRPMFPAFQANVISYTIAVLGHQLGERTDLDRVWNQQDISPGLVELVRTWSTEVNELLHATSGGRMISEWAKKPECWDVIRARAFRMPAGAVPELR
jgi:hypothetical protein